MGETLLDVADAIAHCWQCTFNNLRCCVVNYTAAGQFPYNFFYKGCNVKRADGTYCARAKCQHHSRFKRPMYRFQLQLTDQSPSPPVTVSVFEQAHILMGISAEQLSRFSPERQLAMVRAATCRGEQMDIFLCLKEDSFSWDFVGVVQTMFRVNSVVDEVMAELMGTPFSLPVQLGSGDIASDSVQDLIEIIDLS